ncbi:MAG: FtsX-like permease family protein, partial [Candidatus Bathyarchaeota archaeon]
CISGVSLATIFIVAIGTTTTNYTNVIRDMNVFFREEIVVVAEGSWVVQAFPVIGENLPISTLEKVNQVEGVKTVVPMVVRFGYQVEAVIQLVPTNVSIGIPFGNLSVLIGQTPLKPGGTWPVVAQEEVVVGPSLALEWNFDAGSKIKVSSKHAYMNLTVSGILDTRSALLSRSIILPLRLAQQLSYGHTMFVNMIIAEPEYIDQQELIANRIEQEIPGLKALSINERNQIVEPLLSDIETWNLGLSSVLYLLSMILVIMVSTMNISERRRDFATLDAIGAPKSTIFRIVMIETALIGLLGGVLGVLLGSIAAVLIASIYTSIPLSLFFADLLAFISPFFLTKIITSTVVISSIAGILSAITALRINLPETLRAEY